MTIGDSVHTPTPLRTDHYEFTMLEAALAGHNGDKQCVFEVFSRRLSSGRRYGVVAGIARLAEAIETFRFSEETLDFLRRDNVVARSTIDWLRDYRFSGDIDVYREGDLYFPGSPIATVRGTFAECILLETLTLSILNHDSAVASAAARMVTAARGRPILEMGGRRTHESAAVAAARASYLAGFSASSNLAAGARWGVPTGGTSAHAFTLLHGDEKEAFRAQIAQYGTDTTLLVDTYDITQGIRNAIEVAGPRLRSIRIDSGDLSEMAMQSRELLDSLGAKDTKIIVSGDLDEYAIAALSGAPVDTYGAGTAVVTGSGVPTAGFVYKLVEVEGRPVAKRSESKVTVGGAKTAIRRHKPTGTAIEEVVVAQGRPDRQPGDQDLQVPLFRGGKPMELPSLSRSREFLRQRLISIPWEGLKLSPGDPAIPVIIR
ncbi:nicotinate phosphoribosyltransferase [Natronoglycomyces albus]|uniref:Nicotinate phosphoribosyltransferase n=1 Tax=Natronoglycomyces albus TaxID=2811108 RepID=A0A895XLG0_9ACTN|nr:nicotinate phosphoribosyltransferase [Natronoglycomyces albus]QSB05907.1 nicotinate phosphoribosyltransferase [Natronoglycomyces albus]